MYPIIINGGIMKNFKIKKFTLICVSFLSCIVLSCCFSGCSTSTLLSSNNESAQKSVYQSSVNVLSKDINSSLSNFDSYLKKKNIDKVKEAYNNIQSKVDTFNKLTVPDNYNNVHKLYSDAFTQLQAALKDYINVYIDIINKSQTTDVLNTRISSVQAEYSSGIDLLGKADKAIEEL
jgi:cellobiose-specific phosphotransferase system component IIB